MRFGWIKKKPFEEFGAYVRQAEEYGFDFVGGVSGFFTKFSPKSIEGETGKCRLGQIGVWNLNMCHSDGAVIARGIDQLKSVVEWMREAGTSDLVIPAGTAHPDPPTVFTPHKNNLKEEAFSRFVENMRRVVSICEEEGIVLAIEPHILSMLNTKERCAQLIKEVSSPNLKINMDVFNLMGIHEYWQSTEYIGQAFDMLDGMYTSAHIKGIVIKPQQIFHLSEAEPGDGDVDYAELVRRLQAGLPEDGVAYIEHTEDENVAKSLRFLKSFL